MNKTLRSFGSKRFYETEQPLANTARGQRTMGCLNKFIVACLMGVGVILLYKGYQNYSVSSPTAPAPLAAIVTPNVLATALQMVQTAIASTPTCTEINAECGSMATPSAPTHVLTSLEKSVLAVVYPTPAPIPAGEDGACFYADKYGVACDDVQAAELQMREWMAKEGR